MLKIYATLDCTRALGPFVRFALWVQGCPRRCPGCMTPQARPLDGGKTVPIRELACRIGSLPEIEGITISGGEPFLQPAALAGLLAMVQTRRDLGVIVYTGFTLETLTQMGKADPGVRDFLSAIDLLIDGPYVRELDDGRSLRGSSNQRVLSLTRRYEGVADAWYGVKGRKAELHVLDETLFLAGVPGADMLRRWRNKQLIEQ